MRFQGKFTILRRCYFRNISRTRQIILSRPKTIRQSHKYREFDSKVFTKKQTDIDKILKVIQRKVLKGTHILVEIMEIQTGYLNSQHFKDIFLYLSQNKLPPSKAAIRKVEMLAERYILLDSVVYNYTRERISSFSSSRDMCQ